MNSTYREPAGPALPISYGVLQLPSKAAMKKKGYDPSELKMNGLEGHPLSKWTSTPLPKGTSYKEAVSAINKVNEAAPWGIVKIRINFDDGSHEVYERANVGDPSSLANTHTYSPNEAFHKETMQRTAASRPLLSRRLQPLVDERGHYTGSKKLPKTFAPETLYRDAPPPVHSQAGYDFTPISHGSYLLRPHDEPAGTRKLRSNFMHESCDYRPRAYLRQQPRESRHCHCAEVFQAGDYTIDIAQEAGEIDHKNHRCVKHCTAGGSVKPHSTVVGRRHYREPRFGQTGAGASRSEQRRLKEQQGGGVGSQNNNSSSYNNNNNNNNAAAGGGGGAAGGDYNDHYGGGAQPQGDYPYGNEGAYYDENTYDNNNGYAPQGEQNYYGGDYPYDQQQVA